MHNCKATKERVTELILSGVDARPVELIVCRECANEFDSINETLRITKRQIEAIGPAESYWTDYHQELKQKLNDQITRNEQVVTASPASKASWLSRLFGSSIRVPVPVAAALLLMFIVLWLSGTRSPQQKLPVQTASVIHVPVQVPVIQEKVVTKVVYRKSKRRSPLPGSNKNDDLSTVAKSQKVSPPSLVGFKPLDEVKLTVIKGGSPDEK